MANKKVLIIGGIVVVGGGLAAYLLSRSQASPAQSGGATAINPANGQPILNTANISTAIDQGAGLLDKLKSLTSSNKPTALQQLQAQLAASNPYAAEQTTGMTLATLKAKNWRNNSGSTGLAPYIESYNPTTGQVTNRDHGWVGLLVNPNRIEWRKNNGEQDIWTAV